MKTFRESANYGRTYPLHGETLERKKEAERQHLHDAKRARINAQREAANQVVEPTVRLSKSTKDLQPIGVSYHDWMAAKRATRLQRERQNRTVRV